MATIHIEDLSLRAIIGINDWERTKKQEVIINLFLDYNAVKASKTDNPKHMLDYKAITKSIIKEVESSKFFLLEKLADHVLQLVMKDTRIKEATIRIDKPHALRFAKSVSVELTKKRKK